MDNFNNLKHGNSNNESNPDSETSINNDLLPKQKKETESRNNFLKTALKPKFLFPIVTTIVIFSLLLGLINFWPLTREEIVKEVTPVAQELFSGFSKLVISPAHADDNFTFKPLKIDSAGADADTSYILKSKEPIETKLIEENLKIEPSFDYSIKEISDTEWHIIPGEPIPANTLVKAAMSVSYETEDGEKKERDYSWVYQIKDTFKVIHSIPREAGTNVPVSSGIEITFSHDNFKDFEKYFEIRPKTEGFFEKHGRTAVFVAKNQLAHGAIYSVTIKKGLPLTDSSSALLEDYTFTFETLPDGSRSYSRNGWLNIYQRFIEASSEKQPAIQISSSNVPGNQVDVDVYQFKDIDDYLRSVQNRDNLPWWSYSKEDFREDVSKMMKITSLKLDIKTTGRIQYIEFPEKFNKGYYLLDFANTNRKHQAWLQVSDLSAYYNITKSDSIIWVNNLLTKSPARSAKVEIINSPYKYQADINGIAKFNTPTNLIEKATDKKENKRNYFKITLDNDVLILPASQISRNYGWSRPNKADNYWNYLYTDRPRYQTTDTIKYWGMIKNRSNKNITDDVTVTLYKEGYMDYYYKPVKIIEQTVELSDFDTFLGEINLKNLRPDYYTLEMKIGEEVIRRKYVHINPYTKPAYELSITPDHKYAFAGTDINLKIKASFFEGTPVPGLELILKMPEGDHEFTTNDQGEADLTYTKKYVDCHSSYSCWPNYAYISVKPKNSELAEIVAGTSLRFYGPNIYLENNVSYPEEGVAEVSFTSKYLDFDSLVDSYWWKRNKGEKPAPYAKIEGELEKTTYSKVETGTKYDFINKKSYKTYRYDKHTEIVDKFIVNTDENGLHTYKKEVEPSTSYKLILKAYDKDGRYEVYNNYLYYYNGRHISRYSSWNYTYYHFELPENTEYSVGDKVVASFMQNEETMPDNEGKYLYLQLQNGLQEHSLSSSHQYTFDFEKRDIPNVNLIGVYFNGSTYLTTRTSYYGRSVQFDTSKRALKIEVDSDKEMYEPGSEITLDIEVKDIKDRPVQAQVNLNLVDEAFYAVADDEATPMDTIYSNVGPGSLYSKYTHYSITDAMSGAEKGGCFAAGTSILMADGSTKTIENIKNGDQIKTFSDPINKNLINGTVTKVWIHTVGEYLIINDDLKVTPEHQVFSKNRFIDIGLLKIGDWLMNNRGEKVYIKSIEHKFDIIKVYNFRVDPQHTYFAGGFYVHNQEKGGGPRELFTDAALFDVIKTDTMGKASITFTLPDNITSWRVTSQAISKDIYVGVSTKKIPVSLPVFAEVTIGNEYLLDDKPVARMRAYGKDLNSDDQANFYINAPSLNIGTSSIQNAKAFSPSYFKLPEFKIGNHKITYNLNTNKGDDAIRLPISIVKSRISAQTANSSKLTTDTKILAENDLPVTIVLSDMGQNQLYPPLQSLSWSWGDRVDQKLSRNEARIILEKYYNEEILKPKFNAFNYQTSNGGIALLPYSGAELELSARIASLRTDGFDKESLAQYFYKVLEDRNSNREEITLALFGLASLEKPMLPRIQEWLKRDDLSPKEKLYLALALYDLGAKEWSRNLYNQVTSQYAEKKDPQVIIKVSENQDEVYHATALGAVLATSLGVSESTGLWEYLNKTQRLWGNQKNSENLFNLEKLNYIKHTLPNLKPSPAKIKYSFLDKEREVNITGGQTFSLQIDPSHVEDMKFLEIEGDVGISISHIKPVNLSQIETDNDISIKRGYYLNGKKTTTFKENDIIEVRLYPKFEEDSLEGNYQITDILPSGMMPVTKIHRWGGGYDCRYWRPYNTDGQKIKFNVYKFWNKNNWCTSDYIKYYARIKNRGSYIAEPAIIQSFQNPNFINYSNDETVVIE